MQPNFDIEDSFDGPVCGIDEVGRGPLAGPVVACAVILKDSFLQSPVKTLIRDSKTLTARQRQKICAILPDVCYSAIGSASVEEIDEHNIYHATFIAMQRAHQSLCKTIKDMRIDVALVDGNRTPQLPCQAVPVVKGDAKSFSIAAASILAKEYRDDLMRELSEIHPHYGWERNAGYGTKQHKTALQAHGATEHHRKSFKPVYKVISLTC